MEIDGKTLKASFISFLKVKILEKRKQYRKGIHLIDLLYCPHKVRFNKESNHVSDAMAINVHRGKGLHKYLQEYCERRCRGIKIEEVYHMNVVLGVSVYKVIMTPDIVVKDVVIEFKTVKSIRIKEYASGIEPYTHHLTQLMYYVLVTGAKRGILLYYDIANSAIESYDLDSSELNPELLKRVLQRNIWDYHNLPKVAKPYYSWECKFCEKRSCPRNINKEK